MSNDHTALAGDRVIGIDFSAGLAAAATAINNQLAPAINASATATGLRFLDDGAGATTELKEVSSRQTATVLQDAGTGLALFMDGNGPQLFYSRSMEGRDQKNGLASRISVNRLIADNNELLVRYASGPQTAIGDTTRPLDMLERLNKTKMPFSARAGIGAASAPYKGSVADYARLVIADQTGKAESAARANQSQAVVVGSLQQRLEGETGVEIDEELSRLISLQNSYAANARILQAVDEMMQQLMRI